MSSYQFVVKTSSATEWPLQTLQLYIQSCTMYLSFRCVIDAAINAMLGMLRSQTLTPPRSYASKEGGGR